MTLCCSRSTFPPKSILLNHDVPCHLFNLFIGSCSYWIDVTHGTPDPNQKSKQTKAAKKRTNQDDHDAKPVAKKPKIVEQSKHCVGPFPFEDLPAVVQECVFWFVDVPTLAS